MRSLLPAVLLLPLVACTGMEPDMGMRSSAALLPQTTGASAPVGALLPPEAGRVLSSSERDEPRSRLRRTVLEGEGTLAGENFVTVETGGSAGPRSGLLRPPRIEAIQAEMRAALPGVSMRLGDTSEENAGGPFGYALGRTGGTACIYAWQWLDMGRRNGLLSRRDPAGIRVRLCRGTQFEPLLAAVRAMRIAGSGSDADIPGGDPGFGGDALAATGVGTVPAALPQASLATASAEAVDVPAPARKIRRAAPTRAQQAAIADAPAIPLPPSAAAGAPTERGETGRPASPAVEPGEDDTPLIPDPGITASTR